MVSVIAWCSESLSPFTAGKLDGPAVSTGSCVCVLASNEFGVSFLTSSSSLDISTILLIGFGLSFVRFGMKRRGSGFGVDGGVVDGGGTYSSTVTISSVNRSSASGISGRDCDRVWI